jgi:hypothetical protein
MWNLTFGLSISPVDAIAPMAFSAGCTLLQHRCASSPSGRYRPEPDMKTAQGEHDGQA